MRADNSIYLRIASQDKQQFKSAAAKDGKNLSQWLIELAKQRIEQQK